MTYTTPMLVMLAIILAGFYILYHQCPERQRQQRCSLDKPSKASALVALAVGLAIFVAEVSV